MRALLSFLIPLSLVVGVFAACGVKGPPLPPVPATPQQSEVAPSPRPSPSPSPSPGPGKAKKKKAKASTR